MEKLKPCRECGVVGLLIAAAVSPVGGQSRVAEVSAHASPAVFQIIGEYGHGTGFLFDSTNGLVLSNAHVTAGADSVDVKITLEYKVAGSVVLEDRRLDVAVIRVNPTAVAGLRGLPPDTAAYRQIAVGEPVLVVGYPLYLGSVTTAGILSQKGVAVFMTDAGASPGNSGGPVLSESGSVVGMLSFGISANLGAGLRGAVSAQAISEAIARLGPLDVRYPRADSLPVIPADLFPFDALERAVSAPDWPIDLYDISTSGVGGGGYNVHVITPPFLARHASTLSDLHLWNTELGRFPPVVVVRIFPQVGQSGIAALANFALLTVAAVTDSYPIQFLDPAARGSMREFRVQAGAAFVRPLQVRRSRAIQAGVPVDVVHVLLSPDLFIPGADGSIARIVLQIDDADGSLRVWAMPEATARQVFEDFRTYLGR